MVLLPLVIVLVLGLVALRAAWLEWRSLFPPRRSVERPPAVELPGLREVRFRTADGLELAGWYVAARNRAAVLLAHGWGANRTDLLAEGRLLAARGFGVLLYDGRGHGESQGDRTTYGQRERLDVRAAVDFLVAQPEVDPTRVAGLGFSIGAAALALAAAEDARIKGLVLAGATTSMNDALKDEFGGLAWLCAWPARLAQRLGGAGEDALGVEAALPALAGRPLLIVHGEADGIFPVKRARQLFAAASEPKQLLILPGAGHGHYSEIEASAYESALFFTLERAIGASAR